MAFVVEWKQGVDGDWSHMAGPFQSADEARRVARQNEPAWDRDAVARGVERFGADFRKMVEQDERRRIRTRVVYVPGRDDVGICDEQPIHIQGWESAATSEADQPALRVPQAVFEDVTAHVVDAYPEIVCGVLLGASDRDGVVCQARRIGNVGDGARNLFEFDARELIRLQRECDASDLEITAYYNSHPDGPARPSVISSKRSYAGPYYLILSCRRGRLADCGLFIAEQDGGPMRRVAFVIF